MINNGPVCAECEAPYKNGLIRHSPDCSYAKKTNNLLAPSINHRHADNADQAYKFLEIWPPSYPQPEREYRFVAVKFEIGKPGIRERIARAGLHDFRMDYAWPDLKIAVGVDGQARNVKGGGRHSTDKDRLKHNLATLWGWMFFHFSPVTINSDPDRVIEIVNSAINIRKQNAYVINK